METEPKQVVSVSLDGTTPRVVIVFEDGSQEVHDGLLWSLDAPRGDVLLLARRLADYGFPWPAKEIAAHLLALEAGFVGGLHWPGTGDSLSDPLSD